MAGAAGFTGGAADDRLRAVLAALGVDMRPVYEVWFEQQRLRSFWSSHGRLAP